MTSPTARVIRRVGVTAEAVAASLSSPPHDTPAVVTIPARPATSPADAVEAVLSELEAIALNLFPVGIADVHALATDHLGPFLADLAVGALAGRPTRPATFPPEIRAAGLLRVIATSFGRSRVALVVRVPDEFPSGAELVLVAGCAWLAEQADVGVWIVGPGAGAGRSRLPRPGRPRPASKAAQTLEKALSHCDWAIGRRWNQTCRPYGLADPLRVDLLWAAEKCVVDIDGPEHRAPLRYAADRRRDVQLQLHGYAVLRFTNAQIVYDIDTVVGQIERLVRGRRPVRSLERARTT